jgi:Glycosyl hydrolases family 15
LIARIGEPEAAISGDGFTCDLSLGGARAGRVGSEDEAMNHLEGTWDQPDNGLWEMRGPRRHFTHSKVLAWVAADRMATAVRAHHLYGPADRWEALGDTIHADVLAHGYNPDRNTFWGRSVSRLLLLARRRTTPRRPTNRSHPTIRTTACSAQRRRTAQRRMGPPHRAATRQQPPSVQPLPAGHQRPAATRRTRPPQQPPHHPAWMTCKPPVGCVLNREVPTTVVADRIDGHLITLFERGVVVSAGAQHHGMAGSGGQQIVDLCPHPVVAAYAASGALGGTDWCPGPTPSTPWIRRQRRGTPRRASGVVALLP